MADVSQATIVTWAATAIPNVTSLSMSGFGVPTIDVSNLADTAREKIASGLFDGGTASVTVNYEPDNAVHNAIADAAIAGTSGAIVITWPAATTSTYSFTAFPTEFSQTAAVGEAQTADITFDISGTITIA